MQNNELESDNIRKDGPHTDIIDEKTFDGYKCHSHPMSINGKVQ